MNLKLYHFKTDLTESVVINMIKSKRYDEDITSGFLIDKSMNSKIDGRFIYKKIFDEEVTDPFGNSNSIERISYDVFQFKIILKKNILILLSPPRNTKLFFTNLSSALDFSVVIDPLRIDLSSYSNLLKNKLEKVSIRSIEIVNLSFSEFTKAKVSISGSEDVLNYIDEATYSKKNYSIKKMGVSYLLNNQENRFEVTELCNYKIPERNKSIIIPILLSTIDDYCLGEDSI